MGIEAQKEVIDDFREHCSGTRINTRVNLLEILRRFHQGYHITGVEARNVALLEFADAGEATAVLQSGFDAIRLWNESVDMSRKESLTSKFQFACFQFTWKEREYIVYYAEWKDAYHPTTQIYYILSPRDGNVVDIHCAKTDELIKAAGKWTSLPHKEIFVFESGCWKKDRHLWNDVQETSWDKVILDPEIKSNIQNDANEFFDSQEWYASYNVPWKRGILLYGPPGNGKTATIKALMKSLGGLKDSIPSLYVKSFEPAHGESKQDSIGRVFRQARKSAPCLLIFEDLDSLVDGNVRSYFLNQVDGIESNDGILIIASANDIHKLDPAIKERPSRFDRKYLFNPPEMEERIAYSRKWREKVVKNADVEFPDELCDVIGRLTDGLSFAYIQELFVVTSSTILREAKSGAREEEEKKEKEKEKERIGMGVAMSLEDIPEHLTGNLLLKALMKSIVPLRQGMGRRQGEKGRMATWLSVWCMLARYTIGLLRKRL